MAKPGAGWRAGAVGQEQGQVHAEAGGDGEANHEEAHVLWQHSACVHMCVPVCMPHAAGLPTATVSMGGRDLSNPLNEPL